MNFSLINGCGTCKIKICGHSFFIIVTQKVNKEKFVILQSIGIIIIKK